MYATKLEKPLIGPDCLVENPYRLATLLDIVNDFNLFELSWTLLRLQTQKIKLVNTRVEAGGDFKPSAETKKLITEQFFKAHAVCQPIGFERATEQVTMAEQYIMSDPTLARIIAETDHLITEITGEMVDRKFLYVSEDRSSYVDNQLLFGKEVLSAFPSAKMDIVEAGNCLAAECNTAAVFHLMHVAEFGLRALAADRKISLPKNGVIELATWEDILRQLELAEDAIHRFPKTIRREEQYEFYHGAMMEFKRFKNKFRNRVMHTRDDYDRDEAHSALIHVRDFMKILATEISEKSATPEVWI